jgi:CII-binding regulator of phage lambda lysogenization HflD
LGLLNSGEIASARANIEKLTDFGGAAGADSKLVKYAKALVDIAEKLEQAKQESGELNSKLEQLDAQKMELIA